MISLALDMDLLIYLPGLKNCIRLTYLYLGNSKKVDMKLFYDVLYLKNLTKISYSHREEEEYINKLLRTEINEDIKIFIES